MNEKTIICLVRHGRTEWNSRGLIQGQTDNSLDDIGIEQAQTAAKLLLEIDPNWDVIVSSPLKRAYQTGEIIAKVLGYKQDIITNRDFREREFGVLEGQKLTKEMYEVIFRENSEGLETLKQLQERSVNACLALGRKYPGKKILVTTHSQFIKGVLSYLNESFIFTQLLKNSSLNYFEVENNNIKLLKFNITEKMVD